jgi:hypothetical protein
VVVKFINKLSTVGVILLLIGISVSSSGTNIEEVSTYNQIKDEVIISNSELFFTGKTAYAWVAALGPHGEGPCYFDLDNPGDIIQLSTDSSPYFLSGGTWTNNWRWLGVEYYSGSLWEIYPETGEMIEIGGGGVSLNGLAYNLVNNKLYAAASFDLYEIDIKTGEQTYIGDYGEGPEYMIGIAFDADGILFGWDVANDSLWTINTESGQATLVGPLGIDIKYAQDGAFDYDTDILYLAAYTITPNYGGYLYKCDEDTGNSTLVGKFEGGAELTALAIPYYWIYPYVFFNWTPEIPVPSEMIYFNASESFDTDGNITLYEWDWNNDGIYDVKHTYPTAKYSWLSSGRYSVTLRVTDNSSLNMTKTKEVIVDNPPDTPIIEGPRVFKVWRGGKVRYSYYSIDADGDKLRFGYLHGDSMRWTVSYESGEKSSRNISIPLAEGTYDIFKVKAADYYWVESDWAILTVRIVNTKSTFLLGYIGDIELDQDFSIVTAKRLLAVQVKPFDVKIFSSDEVIVISNDHHGFVGEKFIFGRFKADLD